MADIIAFGETEKEKRIKKEIEKLGHRYDAKRNLLDANGLLTEERRDCEFWEFMRQVKEVSES